MAMLFQDVSYEIHKDLFKRDLEDDERKRISNSWFDTETADYWRHERGFIIVDALDRDTSWLTIGDGRWGLDSVKLKRRGFREVMASDICETLLEEGKNKGIIDGYKVINAENIGSEVGTYDYVFCKEAFHHFPRPMKALYEMLRIAKKGVVLVEPNDQKQDVSFTWEEVGNYVYTVSVKEIIKMALALNLPAVSFYGYNDYYIKGCEFEPADTEKSEIFRNILAQIELMDKKVRTEEQNYNKVAIVIFQEFPAQDEIDRLLSSGCTFVKLPCNPYINSFGNIEEKYYIYGTGHGGKRISDYLMARDMEILGYVDSDNTKWGREFLGKEILPPENLADLLSDKVKIIIATLYHDEIKNVLLEMGIEENKILISPLTMKLDLPKGF